MKELIQETCRKELQALIHQDYDVLNQVIAPDAVFVHITGKKQSRDEWFREMQTGRMAYYELEEDGWTIEAEEDKATVTVKTKLLARIYGYTNRWNLASQMRLEKRDGSWVIVRSASTMYA